MNKKPIIFNVNERKRLNMISIKSPYENTKWLISKIKMMEGLLRKYEREIQYLEDALEDNSNRNT